MAALPFPKPAGTALRISIHASLRRPSIYSSSALIGSGFSRNNVLVVVARGRPNAVVRCGNAEWEHGNARLEEELFEFMESSERPNHFPTKEDLLRAGRADLVHGIISQGGWLAAGWNSPPLHVGHYDADEDSSESDVDYDDDVDEEKQDNGLIELEKKPPALYAIDVKAEDVSEKSTGEESGIAAMINRLQRERALSYSEAASAGKKSNGIHQFNGSVESWKTDRGMQGSVNGKGKADDGGFTVIESQGIARSLEIDTAQAEYENRDLDPRENFIKPKRWGIPNVGDVKIETKGEPEVPGVFWQRSRGIEQISSQTMHINDNTSVFVDRVNEDIERRQEWMWDVKTSYGGHSQQIYSRDAANTIMSRIRKLEVQLASSLGSLRSRKDALNINKDYDKNSLEEFEKVSDALEFRETEIMKMRAKLRSTRAKLAALEGKMAMEIMEVRKAIDEKQKKVEEAQKVLSLLRTARIVWPDSASEVFLAGSFDGWTTQRRMGKSNAGVFVTSLQLYPGRYEIKFVVDGIWRVDQQRPIVYNNGFENNLLVIY